MEYIIIYSIVFLLGIVIGSFLNVCIFRLPRHEDIVFKRSHCNSCGCVLKWYELIPIFSFVIQGGRCRSCREKISWQYPITELLNGLIYIWIFQTKGIAAESILLCICASVLLVIAVIDSKTYEIPFGCNIIIGILGVLRMLLDLQHWYRYVIGFFAVSCLFLLVYYLTKGNGMGGGDIKLMASAGLFLGWQNIILALMLGSIAACIIHLALMKLKGKGRVLAFGPYLALGIFVSMLYGNEIISWYLAWLFQS